MSTAPTSPLPDPWRFPRLLHVPPRQGRKPVSIPDITQFTEITRRLFGVDCLTPTEVYSCSTFNELFVLRLDTPEGSESPLPKKVLARVARDAKSRSDISLESEVATMVYVRQRCGATVPVPTVYGYCLTRHNVIGQPFSIISFAEGLDMQGSPWEALPLETKLIAVRDFANIVSQLSRLSFKAIGSIHFKFGDPWKQIPVDFVLGPVSWCKQESAARAEAFTHDRGPWKTAGQWLRAAVNDEVQFIEKLPQLAKETSTRKSTCDKLLLASNVLPRVRERVPDLKGDPFDQCASGPFVLGHMDLNPGNIIFCPKGPNAGKIVSIIDWEMSMTAPLWSLVCYPPWFDRVSPSVARDPKEAQYFKDAYIRELQKHVRDALVLHVVQNAQYESRRRFSEIATLPWDAAEDMEQWLENNPRSR